MTWSQLDGFTETGGGYYNLVYGDLTTSTIAATAGLRVEYEIPTAWSLLTARGRLEYTHDFTNTGTATMGYADLANGLPYSLDLNPFDDNYATLGLGLDTTLSNGVELGLEYRGMIGFGGDEQNQTVAVRFSTHF